MGSKIIYIIGAGRSGTTLLDIILGNGTGIFSAGELNRFTKRNGVPHDARDEKVSYFWKKVTNNLNAKKFKEPGWYHQLAQKFEYHNYFYRFIFPRASKDFKTYAEYQRGLFTAITESLPVMQGQKTIVDSSKYPLRALSLARIFHRDISFIYIQRNPSVVVESFQNKNVEQPSKNRLAANIYLFFVNSLAIWVLRKIKKTNKISIITYDNLISAPVIELEKIEKDIDLDLTIPKQLIEKEMPLTVGYLFDGNRLRLNNQITLRNAHPPASNNKRIDKVFYPLHRLTWYKY